MSDEHKVNHEEVLSAQPERMQPPLDSPEALEAPQDEMSVADTIGERIEMGKGGMPLFLIVALIFVFIWAILGWRPWTGY